MLVVPLIFSSCTEDLADMNINPNSSQIMNYDAQFLYCQGNDHLVMGQIGMSFYACAMQQLAAITLYQAPGDKYVNANDDLGSLYKAEYTSSIKNLVRSYCENKR